jgi:hypothetical protein
MNCPGRLITLDRESALSALRETLRLLGKALGLREFRLCGGAMIFPLPLLYIVNRAVLRICRKVGVDEFVKMISEGFSDILFEVIR